MVRCDDLLAARASLDRPDLDPQSTRPDASAADEGRPNGWSRERRRRLAVDGGALGFAVVVAIASFAYLTSESGPIGDGTLSDAADASPGDVLPAEAASPTATVDASPSPAVITFDERRMGSGIGAGWEVTPGDPGAAEVAPVPNAVDRSARLLAGEQGAVQACRTLAPAMASGRVSVDLMRDGRPGKEIVRLASPSGVIAEMRVGEMPGEAVDHRGRVVGAMAAIEEGHWYRAEVQIGAPGRWRLAPRDGAASSQAQDGPIDVMRVERVDRLCLAVSGEPGAAAHFDNVTVTDR